LKILKSDRSGGQKGRGLESKCPPGIFARPRFSAAEFRISLCEMRRQERCCPCPNPLVRGQRQGAPFIFLAFIFFLIYHYNRQDRKNTI